MKTISERLLEKAEPEPNSGCWLWTGAINSHGYGHLHAGRLFRVHRLAYELFVGEIPPGKWVLHKCDVRHCVNPAHLFLGDVLTNNRDAIRKGRSPFGQRHGQAKLRDEDIPEIRRLIATKSQTEIAKQFGVSRSSIRQVLYGSGWRHVA